MPFPLPLRLTRFFLSSPPPSFLIFISAISPSSSPKGAALRNFCGSESISRRGFSNSATRFFSSLFFALSLSFVRSVFFAQLFPFDTSESREGEVGWEKCSIVGHCWLLLRPLPQIVRGKLCFFTIVETNGSGREVWEEGGGRFLIPRRYCWCIWCRICVEKIG